MRRMNEFVCLLCGKLFQAYQQQGRKYCSRACSNEGRGGPKSPNGSGSVGRNGYRYIRANGRRRLEHRHVMEKVLGRPLLPNEIVHHKDGNRLNNSPSNLELKANQAEHMREHVRRFASETRKQCGRCDQIKPRTEFVAASRNGHGRDPNGAYCRSCASAYNRERAERKRGHCPWCGKDNVPLVAAGLCGSCGNAAYVQANRERNRQWQREYRRKKTCEANSRG